MQVWLGNVAPIEVKRVEGPNGEILSSDRVPIVSDNEPGKEVTSVACHGTLAEAFIEITSPNGVWPFHSDAPPAWVKSDSPGLEALLAEHFGCDTGEPAEGMDAWRGAPPIQPPTDPDNDEEAEG